MLLAMAEDVRGVLIQLAERLVAMRHLDEEPPQRQTSLARETLDVLAPLANRLGVWQIKWQLEDLAFACLEPRVYHDIARALAERRVDRERYLAGVVALLERELAKAGVRAQVSARAKHLYGIWRKMQRKNRDVDHIFDVRAVRIVADDVSACYAALGVVHGLWHYIPGEFDDYIATPKENHYRSIHTAVIGPEGKTVEVQIRTHEMHRASELGVAAHWRYKEGGRPDSSLDKKIEWLRQLLEWKDAWSIDALKSAIFEDRVYVFTPKGAIVDLPRGATPLDFAYHIHTEVGHRCRGAKVNGRMLPLTYALKTGEQVEIVTAKEGGPSRDWLNPHLGYLKTAKARAKVQQWFKEQQHDENVALGRALLARELARLGAHETAFDRLAERLGFAGVDALLVAFAHGEVRPQQLLHAVQPAAAPAVAMPAQGADTGRRTAASAIQIQGVGNLLNRLAGCCRPLPGDPIVGYITRGKGITVHRRDCANALRHLRDGERVVDVAWGDAAGTTYPVEVHVVAHDRPGLLRDIGALLANERINVARSSTVTDKRRQLAHIALTLEIPDVDALSRVLAQIDTIPNVLEVSRKG